MRALTVQQPWASVIASGAKLVENRSRHFTYRGPLAILAGQTWHHAGGLDPRVLEHLGGPARPEDMPAGAVVAVAELIDCHQAQRDAASPTGVCCPPWGDHTHYRRPVGEVRAHHLVLADVVALTEPVPARGFLGVWRLSAAERAAVDAALPPRKADP